MAHTSSVIPSTGSLLAAHLGDISALAARPDLVVGHDHDAAVRVVCPPAAHKTHQRSVTRPVDDSSFPACLCGTLPPSPSTSPRNPPHRMLPLTPRLRPRTAPAPAGPSPPPPGPSPTCRRTAPCHHHHSSPTRQIRSLSAKKIDTWPSNPSLPLSVLVITAPDPWIEPALLATLLLPPN